MASESQRLRLCIVTLCFLFGSYTSAPVQANGPPSAQADDASAGIAAGGRTVSDGVYSVAQSQRGERRYMQVCRRCHQRDLAGDFVEDAPPLVGEEFLSEWAPWTVGDLFEYLTTEMPPKPKDRLEVTAENHVDILAFILMKNGFPTGQTDLVPDYDVLVDIEMRSRE